MITTISARDFARDFAQAKRSAGQGPVFITDRGQPRYVLMTVDEYHRSTGAGKRSLLALMDGLPSSEGIDFDPVSLDVRLQDLDL